MRKTHSFFCVSIIPSTKHSLLHTASSSFSSSKTIIMEKKKPLEIVYTLTKPQQQQPTPSTDQTQSYLRPNKRKLSSENDDAAAAKKRVCTKKSENKNLEWGYSTDLMLYDDPWKIKKTLTQTDLGDRWLRLLVPADIARNLILPVLEVKTDDDALTNKGFLVRIWDVNTESEHKLNFKLWKSSGGYIFNRWWMEDFVKRRDLKRGDEIGFHWDPYKRQFDFSVIKRAGNTTKEFSKRDFMHNSEMMEWGSS